MTTETVTIKIPIEEKEEKKLKKTIHELTIKAIKEHITRCKKN
jgi:hypothetical protein